MLDVVALRQGRVSLGVTLQRLGYTVVPESQNFQFEKPIPNSAHTMRVELLAPAEYKRRNNFRVDLGDDVHARACSGGSIVLAESDSHEIFGRLPWGVASRAYVRVSRPHALVFMKCLAIDDRYRNLRGLEHYEHDRDSARTHVADIVDILTAQTDPRRFRENFIRQFDSEPNLRARVSQITREYFARDDSPGLLLYEEYLAGSLDLTAAEVSGERRRAHRLLSDLAFES